MEQRRRKNRRGKQKERKEKMAFAVHEEEEVNEEMKK